ncbi:MAG: flagellar biosynthetic protein FliO [Oxalobacteraceae bacterium]|jgi:flagellar protein FliO/FliZ|nr:flagellar biosynthetic protein FliO [Oxalobacteraceae bacterium]
MHATDWLSFIASFTVVLVLLGLVLFALKKMQNGGLPGMSPRRIRILDTISIGPRQKIILLRVKDEDILVGVTAQQINTLAGFPLSSEEMAADQVSATASSEPSAPLAKRFADLLNAAKQNKDGG